MKKQNEYKICRHCSSQIPKKASICPVCKKKTNNGCLGVFLCTIGIIIALTMFISMMTSNEKSDLENEDNERIENVEENKNDDSKIKKGECFENSGLKINIDDTDENFTDYEDEYGLNIPEDGMKYAMASFTFENQGKSDKYVSIYDFNCYADNISCDQVYTLDDSDFINTNLSSGRKVSFKTYYSVPKNAKEIELEYETNILTGEKVIIKIK